MPGCSYTGNAARRPISGLPRVSGAVPENLGREDLNGLSSNARGGVFRERIRWHPRRPAGPSSPRAGVFRRGRQHSDRTRGLPRAHGGVPGHNPQASIEVPPSPRTRGCSAAEPRRVPYPQRLPRPCGGVPATQAAMHNCRSSSPRPRGCSGKAQARPGGRGRGQPSSPPMQGCSLGDDLGARVRLVFPAHAGMFRRTTTRSTASARLPRPRGGVPAFQRERHAAENVFPACAGVFPRSCRRSWARACLPCPGGGVPFTDFGAGFRQESSLRTRGCSGEDRAGREGRRRLPRARGVFPLRSGRLVDVRVFPAHAGVFRRATTA